MTQNEQMLTAREAARMLGISYPTIKHWILAGKLRTVRTPGGHHRVPLSTLKPLLSTDQTRSDAEFHGKILQVSGRNQLAGRVLSVRVEGLMAEVVLEIGESTLKALITSDAVEELGLKPGDVAAALIQSTDVMLVSLKDETN